MNALEHVTITSGASRMSARSEVSDDAVDEVRSGLAAGGDLGEGWSVSLLDVPDPKAGRVYDLLYQGQTLARCWLCLDKRASEDMWAAASSRGALPGTRLHRPRRTPWLAATLLPAAFLVPDPVEVLMALGDLERRVAWALIE